MFKGYSEISTWFETLFKSFNVLKDKTWEILKATDTGDSFPYSGLSYKTIIAHSNHGRQSY
jgi:hypothetical protein